VQLLLSARLLQRRSVVQLMHCRSSWLQLGPLRLQPLLSVRLPQLLLTSCALI